VLDQGMEERPHEKGRGLFVDDEQMRSMLKQNVHLMFFFSEPLGKMFFFLWQH